MTVVTRNGSDRWRQHGRQGMQEAGRICHPYACHTGELCCLIRHAVHLVTKHCDSDIRSAQPQCALHATGSSSAEPVSIMLGNHQHVIHLINPFAARALTSSPTSLTITPLPRTGGGAKCTAFNCGRGTMPSAASSNVSRGFFLAL